LLAQPDALLPRARYVVEELSLCLSAGLLLRQAPQEVGDAYVAARLELRGLQYGSLPATLDIDALLARAFPA
jgi:putative acyl-CoA dehydrogenase